MLCSLTLARLRVILLPCEACLGPLVIDGLDEVFTQVIVEIVGLGLVRAWNLCIFLNAS